VFCLRTMLLIDRRQQGGQRSTPGDGGGNRNAADEESSPNTIPPKRGAADAEEGTHAQLDLNLGFGLYILVICFYSNTPTYAPVSFLVVLFPRERRSSTAVQNLKEG